MTCSETRNRPTVNYTVKKELNYYLIVISQCEIVNTHCKRLHLFLNNVANSVIVGFQESIHSIVVHIPS